MKKLLIHMIGIFIIVICSAAVATDSPLDRFTAEERQKLEKGEAVFKHVQTKSDDGETRGHGESAAIINKPIDQCWKILLEYDKMHLYFPRKTKSEVVEKEGNRVAVYKEFSFYVTSIKYTMDYFVDADAHRIDYKINKKYPSDIKDTEGIFLFEKVDEKRTLFTYAVLKLDTGVKVPGFIQEYITSKDLPAVVLNVKKRIESGGKWTKDD